MFHLWLIVFILFENSSKTFAYPDGTCYTRSSGQRGLCKPLRECAAVRADFQQNIFPTLCNFFGSNSNPIVCCPLKLRRIKPQVTKPPSPTKPKETKSYGNISRKKCSEISQFACPNLGTTRSNKKINYNQLLVKGMKSLDNEFPHMAAIGYGELRNIIWQCGGSLISENFVLTAAHCLFSREFGSAKWVHLGDERLQDALRGYDGEKMIGHTHQVLRRIRHPNYHPPSKYNDIALIELGPIVGNSTLPEISEFIYPACLHTGETIPSSRVTATGWGRIGFGEELSSNLLKVDLNIIDYSTCNESYTVEISSTLWLIRGIDSSLMCAGDLNEGRDTCLGDSGGPLQFIGKDSCAHTIIAVTSFGKVCGLENAPGVYTRVSYFIPWIESIVWPNS